MSKLRSTSPRRMNKLGSNLGLGNKQISHIIHSKSLKSEEIEDNMTWKNSVNTNFKIHIESVSPI
jgi:hypothetical protein